MDQLAKAVTCPRQERAARRSLSRSVSKQSSPQSCCAVSAQFNDAVLALRGRARPGGLWRILGSTPGLLPSRPWPVRPDHRWSAQEPPWSPCLR